MTGPTSDDFKYDVFISYSHADKDWVRGDLLDRLTEAELRVCIDYRDFVAGTAALINMQEAVKQSRHTLLVLTPDWVESEWTLYESLLARTKDPAGLQRRTIPLRLKRCDIPDFISIFESFLSEMLAYLSVDTGRLGPRQQVDALLRLLQRSEPLLVLDGFERALRAYANMGAAYQGDDLLPQPPSLRGKGEDLSPLSVPERGWGRGSERDCVSPLAEAFLRGAASLPGVRGRVLLTTRLLPRALEAHGGGALAGARDWELTEIDRADAVAFFRAQGIRGGRAEIEAACAPYGCHPLSLRLLAGLVARDPQQPGDVRAAARLDVSGDLAQRRHHVLEQAYASLTPARQQLLSRIACFRGPVRYEALRAIAGDEAIDDDLRDLMARGLLYHDRAANRYDLHPIVRRYAYDWLGEVDRRTAHGALRDYFAAVPAPDRVQTLDDLSPVIELYHHTVRAGEYDAAWRLFRDRISTPT